MSGDVGRVRPVPGHGLQGAARGFDADGLPTKRQGVGGPGRAKCACGELSEVLASRLHRKRWHLEHRASLLASMGVEEAIPGEEWRELSFDPRYAVSSIGRIRGAQGFMLAQSSDRDGYPTVNIGGTRKVHQLVCAAFVGPRPSPSHGVAHANGVRTDNRAENLRWATQAENLRDAVEHGTLNVQNRRFAGPANGGAKFTWDQVDHIRSLAASGLSSPQIGRMYGVDRSTILAITSGRRYRLKDRPIAVDDEYGETA